MRKTKGSYQKKSAKIGFAEWNLDAIDEAKEFAATMISKVLQEGIELATKEYECYAWFPIEFTPTDGAGEKAPEDPTTIYVELPIGTSEDESPRWAFQLSDLIDNTLDLHTAGDDYPVEDDARPILLAIRNSLQGMVDKIDQALDRKGGDNA